LLGDKEKAAIARRSQLGKLFMCEAPVFENGQQKRAWLGWLRVVPPLDLRSSIRA
jgi:hypothetical protein